MGGEGSSCGGEGGGGIVMRNKRLRNNDFVECSCRGVMFLLCICLFLTSCCDNYVVYIIITLEKEDSYNLDDKLTCYTKRKEKNK